MIRTEYTRMIPINIRFPDLGVVTTGYRIQRAWMEGTSYLLNKEVQALLAGEEIPGFEWRDEPEAP